MASAFRVPRQALRRLGAEFVRRVRERGRSALMRALRISGAAVASYVVALWLGTSALPLLAALTAVIVVQATLHSTMTNAFQRVVSVVAGVALAVVFGAVVELTWWSLGLLIAASVIVGQLLRLGPHLVEVPISAMLVLGTGVAAAETAATDRIVETIVGAAVGFAVNVVFPPAVRNRHASAAIERFAAELARVLDAAAEDLATGVSVEQASRWLDEARRLNRHVPRVDRALAHSEESRQLNLRALTEPDIGPTLRSSLEVLEHWSVAMRALFRAVLEAAKSRAERQRSYDPDVMAAVTMLLRDLAEAVRSFGRLIRAEAEGSREAAEAAEAQLSAAAQELREARARLTDLLLVVDPRDDPALWELDSTLLATVERVLRELEVREHGQRREQRRRRPADLAADAVDRWRTTTRQLGDIPLRSRAGEPPERAGDEP